MIDSEEKRKERIRIEITNNSVKYLTYMFDNLLCYLDTEKYGLPIKESERTVKRIKDYTFYRLHENVIPKDSKLWEIIENIYDSPLKSKKEIEKLYLKLLKIRYYDKDIIKPGQPRLNHPKSKYFSQKAKETSKKEGEKIISKFFDTFK